MKPMKPMKPSELLEKKGWIQGKARSKDGYCLVYAIDKCCFDDDAFWEMRDKLYKHLRNIGQDASLQSWNDTPGRTKEEVIAACKEVGL